MEDGEPGTDLVGEREQVEVGADLAVIALVGLLEEGQVILERLSRLPRGAVDALQLRVLLAPRQYAPPVRINRKAGMCRVVGRCGPRQRSFRQRTVAAQVVVDGQLAAAHLDIGAVGRARATLEIDEFELVRLVGQLRAASSSLTTRREKVCPSLTISRIRFSMRSRSSGWNGCGTSKS